MQRERERARVGSEDVGGAVALVHVAVDHQHALGEPVAAQRGDRHGDVVEEAVAARERVPGMVRAAAEVQRHAVLQRMPCRRDRAGDRPAPALDQLGRPRQPEAALLAHRQPTVADAREQVAVVHRAQLLPPDRARLVQLAGAHEPVRDDALREQLVLVERELVARRQREAPAVVGPDVHLGVRLDRHGATSSYGPEHRRGHGRVRRDRRGARARAGPSRLCRRAGRPPRRAAARARRRAAAGAWRRRAGRAVRPDRRGRAACARGAARGRRARGRRRLQQRRLRHGVDAAGGGPRARAGRRAGQRRGGAPPHRRIPGADGRARGGRDPERRLDGGVPAAARASRPTPRARRSCSRSPRRCTRSWAAPA